MRVGSGWFAAVTATGNRDPADVVGKVGCFDGEETEAPFGLDEGLALRTLVTFDARNPGLACLPAVLPFGVFWVPPLAGPAIFTALRLKALAIHDALPPALEPASAPLPLPFSLPFALILEKKLVDEFDADEFNLVRLPSAPPPALPQ